MRSRGVAASTLLFLSIGSIGSIGSPDASAAPPESQLAARLQERVARPIVVRAAAPMLFQVQRYRPLLTEPHANCHAVALHAGRDALTVVHRWDHTGEYDAAAVPWGDIVADKVRYSLSSMYAGPRQKQRPDGPPSCPPGIPSAALQKRESTSAPRCQPLPGGETLIGQGQTLRLLDAQKVVRWTLALPAGHTLIDFTPFDGLLLVATVSDQGARDGELRRPYPTTQILAIEPPPTRR